MIFGDEMKVSVFADLPELALLRIINFLPIKERFRFMVVSKYWQRLSLESLRQFKEIHFYDGLRRIEIANMVRYQLSKFG